MDTLYLRQMELSDKEQVLDYIKEMVISGSNTDGIWYTDETSFEDMFAQIKKHGEIEFSGYEQKIPVKFQYLLLRETDHRIVGVVSIRPFLTRGLDESYGGNIGYSIRPTERRQGYAVEGLRLAILECKKINKHDAVMLCCNADNIGSKKAIIKNGGRLIAEKPGIIPQEKYLID